MLLAAEPTSKSSTPILDSGVLPPRPRRGGVAFKALAIGFLLAVALMEIVALVGVLHGENGPAIFLLLFLAAIVVHEVGHLLAGWAVGFHFALLQIGPLLIEREYGTLRASIWLDVVIGGYAGMYANKAKRLRRRLLIYIAGGPAANFLTAIVIVLASHLISLPETSWIGTAAGQLAAISLLLGMFSSVPLKNNDAALVEVLMRHPLPSRRFMSTMALGSQFVKGVRPRDWKQTWINAATYLSDNSPNEFYGRYMAYLAANDGKDADLAARHLERCLELAPLLTSRLRDLIAHEAVVFSAWFKTNPDLAERWLKQVARKSALSPTLQMRQETSLYCARGEFDAAMIAWQKARGLIERMPVNPPSSSLKDSWIEWRAEILERQATLTTT